MRKLLIAMLLLTSMATQADFRITTTANIYGSLSDTQAIGFKVGGNVYGWGNYEVQETRMLGQALAEVNIFSLGLGVKKEWDGLSLFIEGGYAIMDTQPKTLIQQEVVYTQLVRNHHVVGRPLPVDTPEPYDMSGYSTSYELSNTYVARIGVSYEILKHLDVVLAYRWMTPDEHYELWDEERRYGKYKNGWWQESVGRDLSAVEFGLMYKF